MHGWMSYCQFNWFVNRASVHKLFENQRYNYQHGDCLQVILNRRISKDSTTPPLCQLEVSESGLKMIDLTHKKVG